MNAHHIAHLREIVGDANCLTAPEDTELFTTDYRKVYTGEAIAVVRPASSQQVSNVMRYCYEQGIAVVPQGGNTSLMGGSVPAKNATASASIVLSLSRLNKVVSVDPLNDTLVVQAGVTLAAAREAADGVGRLFPLRIGSEGSCQIGGNLSTNAGGTAVLRYGNMRDLVLGLEVVLPDGSMFNGLRELRKDNTGYDLKQLFIGAEGTLGIITAAVLKMFPKPRSTSAALVAVSDLDKTVELLAFMKTRLGHDVTAFELISKDALALVRQYLKDDQPLFEQDHDWMVLVEAISHAEQGLADEIFNSVLAEAFDQGLVTDALLGASEAHVRRFWLLREEISDAQTRHGGSVRCDISVPLSSIPEFIYEASAKVLALEQSTRMVIYGHMGDGNVHFNPLRPPSMSAKEFIGQFGSDISERADSVALSLGGSISAEHGIGVAKRDALLHAKDLAELETSWRIKRALDPKNLLNPGKVLPQLCPSKELPQ